jgi:hypothetical protein
MSLRPTTSRRSVALWPCLRALRARGWEQRLVRSTLLLGAVATALALLLVARPAKSCRFMGPEVAAATTPAPASS